MIKGNNKGFTLIEIIISIAVLSIISAVFLELFIKSDLVQKQGKSIDDKTFLSSNLLEKILASETVEAFIEEMNPSIEKEEDGQISLDFFYDKALLPAKAKEGEYYLHMKLKKEADYTAGTLYHVRVSATVAGAKDDALEMETYYYERRRK